MTTPQDKLLPDDPAAAYGYIARVSSSTWGARERILYGREADSEDETQTVKYYKYLFEYVRRFGLPDITQPQVATDIIRDVVIINESPRLKAFLCGGGHITEEELIFTVGALQRELIRQSSAIPTEKKPMAEEKHAESEHATEVSDAAGATRIEDRRIRGEAATGRRGMGAARDNINGSPMYTYGLEEVDEEAELSQAVEEAVEHVERARELMRRDEDEIERLKSETRAMISKLLAA